MALFDKTVRRNLGEAPNNNRTRPFLHQPESRFSHVSIMAKLEEARTSDIALWDMGKVKWFDQTRRYGFITSDDGIEIFLPWTVLQESNIPEKLARIGTPVRFRCDPPEAPGKRPRATHVILINR